MSRNRVQTTICPSCRTHNRCDARFCMRCGWHILLDDTYRVVRIIKEGGMGTVYVAQDSAGAAYALKELIDRFVDPDERAEAVQRFLEEARILRELRHPSIPRVYRSFLHGGRYYLAMDVIDGEDLEELARQRQRFPEEIVLKWADQISQVLSYLHGRGVIYRDVKPSNIMIEHGSGAVKLVDFGVAKLFQPAQRGTLIGTPGYAPPEQYQGLATPQSDIYAFGATLHHLLTGRDPREEAPFSFPPVRALAPEVSRETALAIERALEMDAPARWPDAAAFRAALPLDLSPPQPAPNPPSAQHEPLPAPRRYNPQPALAMPRIAQKAAPRAGRLPARPAVRLPAKGKRKQGRAAVRAVFSLLVLLVLLLAVAEPGFQRWIQGTLEQALQDVRSRAPAQQPTFRSQPFQAEISVVVPARTSAAGVRAALERAFEQQVKQELDATAFVNANIPVAFVGNIRRLGAESGGVRYAAEMSGYVWAPAR